MDAGVPIVFIHLGPELPSYLRDTVRQARAWNPGTEIVCIAEKAGAFELGETWVELADIPPTEEYRRFQETSILDINFRGGFWRFTTERLFVLQSLMAWRGLNECFHVENDNPIYFGLDKILPSLRARRAGLLAPIAGQGEKGDIFRICLSVLYVNSLESLTELVFSLASAPSSVDEMARCGEYWLLWRGECGFLPVAPPCTVLRRQDFRESLLGDISGYLFDAAAYGQYLGGTDTRNDFDLSGPGYVNRDAEFAADQFLYGWRADGAGRRYPVLMDHDGREWRLANLHIHCKRVLDFMS
jgi:hypothetical protein